MCKRLGLSALTAVLLIASMAARADVQPGFYAGASVGATKLEHNGFDDRFNGLPGANASSIDDSDTGFGVFVGYAFTRHFAIEASYFDLGEASFTTPFGGPADEPVTLTASVAGWNASILGMLPLSDTFSLFARLGFASYDIDTRLTVLSFEPSSSKSSDSESDLTYGVGGSMSFAKHFEARLGFDVYDLEDYDARLISVSALYRF